MPAFLSTAVRSDGRLARPPIQRTVRHAPGGFGATSPRFATASSGQQKARRRAGPFHVEGLIRLGPSPIHRLGWAPVKAALAGELTLELPFEDAAE